MIILPTLAQLYSGILTDLETEYGINISLAQKVALRAIASVHAGKIWLLYKVIGLLQKNIWPDTADTEAQGGTLERFGRVRLGRNPFPPVSGQNTITVTGTAGQLLPGQNTIWKADDTSLNPGILFILDNDFILTGSSNIVTVRCLTPGEIGKESIGNTMTLTSPIALIDSVATVASETVQPLDGETIADYRVKILNSFRLEAQGGAATDYRIWAQDAQGEREVYVYAKPGETNANNIYVEATIADSIDGKGTPSQIILDAVEAVVNFNPDTALSTNERGRRPNTVICYFLPVIVMDIDVVISGGTFTVSEKAAILSAMTTAINLIRPFVAASDPLNTKNDIIDTNKLNGVIYSAVPGAVYMAVTLYIDGISMLSYTFINGNIPWPSSVTYV